MWRVAYILQLLFTVKMRSMLCVISKDLSLPTYIYCDKVSYVWLKLCKCCIFTCTFVQIVETNCSKFSSCWLYIFLFCLHGLEGSLYRLFVFRIGYALAPFFRQLYLFFHLNIVIRQLHLCHGVHDWESENNITL